MHGTLTMAPRIGNVAAAALWAFRAKAEADAARRFERLARNLESVDAHQDVVAMADAAAIDEQKHRRLCLTLVRHFGGQPAEATLEGGGPLRSTVVQRRERVLHEVVAMSCVTETLSTALLGQIREEATDANVREVVHDILVDEVRHARLGWAHLAAEANRGSVAFLAKQLPAMLAHTVSEELFAVGEPPSSAQVFGFGGLSRAQRRQVFVATMRDVVLPGLQRFGVDTAAAARWLDR